jgi:cysteine synthase A
MVPDTGERYLSTPLFADIEAEMDEAEWRISRSTPFARFDAPPPPAAVPAPAPAVTDFGRDFVAATLHDESRPVVMFALEWCEFCWTLRRFFKRIGVPLHAIDVDAAAWHAGQRGAQVRSALHALTGQPTMPQVFVGGQWLGGCTDTLAAWQDGRLPAMLARLKLPFDAGAAGDPHALLPAWLQPREAARPPATARPGA